MDVLVGLHGRAEAIACYPGSKNGKMNNRNKREKYIYKTQDENGTIRNREKMNYIKNMEKLEEE